MAGGIAQAGNAGDFRQTIEQPAKPPFGAVRPLAVPGIHVLAEQRHLAHAGLGQALGLGNDLRNRARDFRTACIGHHTEGAELVAAFLHGEEGGNAALGHVGALRLRQMLELILDSVFGLDDTAAATHPAQHVRQAVIGLRSDDQIDRRRPPDDLATLRLRHAAGDANQHFATRRRLFLLQLADPAKLRIDLLRRPLADVAGVEQHKIGVFDDFGRGIAVGGQRVGHAL